MVAPNIVTTKSIVAKTATVNLTTNPAVVLQNSADSNQLYKISTLLAANVTNDDATITVILTKAVGGGTISKKLAHEIPVPANSTLTLLNRNVPIYLEERTTLIIYADVDLAIDVVCAYEEIGEKATLTTSSSSDVSLSSSSRSGFSINSINLSSSSRSSSSLSSISLSSSSRSSSSLSSISLSSSSRSSSSLSSISLSSSSRSSSSLSSISLSSISLSSSSRSSSNLSSISLSSSSRSSSSLSSINLSSNSSNNSSAAANEKFACITPKIETFACVTLKPDTFACVEPLPGTYLCVELITSSSSSSGTGCADIPDRFSGGTPSLFGTLTGFKATEETIFSKTEEGGWATTYVVANTPTEACAQECQIEISISLACEDNKLNVEAQVGGSDCEIIFDDEIGNEITTDEDGNTLLPGFIFVTNDLDGIDINCNDDDPIAPQCLCPATQPCDPPVIGPPWPPNPVDDLNIKLEVDPVNNNILIPPPAPQGGPQPLRLGLVDCPGCGDLFVTAELVTGSTENESTYNNIVELSCSAGPVTRIGHGRYKANICPVAVGELQVTFTATWENLTKSETVTVNVEYCPTPSDTSSEPSDSAGCGYIECGGTQSYADCYLIDDGLTYELDCAECECVPVAGPSDTSGDSTTSDNSAAAGQCDYTCEMMWSHGNWTPTGMYGPGCDGFACVCPEPDRPGNYENELVFMICQPNPLP